MNVLETSRTLYRMFDQNEIASTGKGNGANIFDVAPKLRNAAKALNRISESECNGVMKPDGFMGWNDDDQARADRLRAKHEKAVIAALAKVFDMSKIVVEFQGDPRGAPVKVALKETGREIGVFY